MFLTSDVFVFIFKNFKNIVLSALFFFGLLYVNTYVFDVSSCFDMLPVVLLLLAFILYLLMEPFALLSFLYI